MTTAAGGVVLVGCGKMGGALLKGWIEKGRDAASIAVIEPDAAGYQRAVASLPQRIARHDTPHDLSAAAMPAVVVFAVKPQAMDEILPQYRRFAGGGTLFLSIAAGKTIASFENALGRETPVVRAMPNTPAAIGRGITAAIGNARIGPAQRDLSSALLGAVGEVVWITREEQMDGVTAVSGSGPAYVFLLAECLAAAGVEAGLPEPLARRLARATVAGAGELLFVSAEEPAQLRENVTSRGGTTAAALAILMAEHGLKGLMIKAVAAAAARSRELAR